MIEGILYLQLVAIVVQLIARILQQVTKVLPIESGFEESYSRFKNITTYYNSLTADSKMLLPVTIVLQSVARNLQPVLGTFIKI